MEPSIHTVNHMFYYLPLITLFSNALARIVKELLLKYGIYNNKKAVTYFLHNSICNCFNPFPPNTAHTQGNHDQQ